MAALKVTPSERWHHEYNAPIRQTHSHTTGKYRQTGKQWAARLSIHTSLMSIQTVGSCGSNTELPLHTEANWLTRLDTLTNRGKTHSFTQVTKAAKFECKVYVN